MSKVNLNQLKKSVFSMKNYIDSKTPTISDSEKYTLRKTITENINFDDPDIITSNANYKSVTKNLEITNESLSKEYISIKIQSDDGITFTKDITEYFINGATTIIADKSTLDANGKAKFIFKFNCKATGLDENGNTVFEINNNYCTFTIRSLEAGKHPLNDYSRSKNWTVTLTYYDISSKYYQKMYNIPANIEDGMGIGSIQQKGNTSTGTFALGSKNNGRGFLLGASNTSENGSCVFGKGNTCVGAGPGYFFGEGNKSHGIGGGFTFGSANNVEGVTIGIGRKLTTNAEKNTNAGAMIVGQGGTLSQDSRFTISTANTNGGDIRYPFDAKDNGDTYIRGKNVLLETETEITDDKSIVNKKYVDDKVASLVDSAPETLDTLKELSTALGNDANFATTMTTTLGNKVDKVDGKALSTNDLTNELKANYDAAYTHSQSAHFDGDYNSLSNIPTDLVKTSDADSKYASIEYVDSNMAIRKLPVHSTTETDKAIIYYVNVMDLLKGAQYATFINPNDERAQQYRIVYVCDDDTVTNIVSLSSTGTNINIVKATHYTNYSNVVYNNIKYKVDYTNHSTSSDVIITKTLIEYLPINNRIEYEPTYEYNPATKKYVDDKFYQTGLMEEVGTIPCSEMQKCNNGTSRYVSSINFDELFSGYEDHVFYGIYDSDKLIRIRYDSTYNRLVTNELAISGTESIALGFDLGTHLMYPFNGGKSDVKAYTFTNDLVIKRVPVFDVNKAATKQYVDDSINSIPKQLVPLSTLIAEDTDGYAYLELNQFEKDKTYIILDDVSTNKFVYATSGIKFKLDGVLLSGAMLFLRTYFPYMTLGIKSSTNTLYFGDADSFWSYNLTNNSKEKNESYSLSMKANKSNVLEKNNTAEYTPTTDYNPSTKKYVDDKVETLVAKDTNKYKLITCDDPLVIAKSDITDIADATITIDNLTGQFGNLTANEDGKWTYTLNTIMTDVETFTFKVNNVEQKLVIVPYREMQYDDSNGGITYDDNWVIEENSKHYNGKSHFTNTNGAEASFNFKGTGISILGKCEPNSAKSVIYLKNVSYTSMDTKLDYEMYQSNYYTKKNLSYNTYGIEFSAITVSAENRYNNYIDSIIVYDTLGTDLNDSIRKLYYGLDSSTGILRTDKENARFMPTRLYDPTTKKYVDELVENSKTTMCTDEEITSMLTEVLGADYSATE